jgi:hypothetical protein
VDTPSTRLISEIRGEIPAAAIGFMPVPFLLFLEQVMGRGRWSLTRRLWQLSAALAVAAIPLEIASPSPGVLLGPYRILVIATLVLSVGNLFAPGQERTPDLRLLRASALVLAAFALYENLRGFGFVPGPPDLEPVGFLFFVAGLGAIADALLARVAAWTGRNAAFDDDLTLVVAGIGEIERFSPLTRPGTAG